ncbi:acetylornithine deacetylase [Palleronia aestuarii]|uniref:Acetylornithine deacetylase n=1 Tax=Palleronia aestuarii TaxID=568105 RepID=A0A2W7N579_9RHOB|nr:acetylornithine deacetylase [Palleronia aestuarii]PZX14883.1 acetylornithine deacetylase [Palleronia aestuarii]
MSWRTAELLDRLVAFPTVSRDSNHALIDWLIGHLEGIGARVFRVDDPEDAKSGVFASIGPPGEGGVLLSSHSDVVPADGEGWSSDPFRLRSAEGRLHARRACDMKGFLAASLAAMERAAPLELSEPLKLAVSWDEEVGCVGIAKMVPEIDRTTGRPRYVLVGEPTGLVPVIAHKGKLVMRATCTGVSGHSSMAPAYVNALHLASDLITALREMQAVRIADGPFDPAYRMPHSTLHAGRMSGGTALNVVPERAVVDLELRHLPAEDADAVRDEIVSRADAIAAAYQTTHPDAAIDLEVVTSYPPLDTGEGDDIVRWLGRYVGDARAPAKVDFGTEAGVFAAAGMAAIVCGPGDIADAHRPDESINAEQLRQCDALLERIAHDLVKR